MIKNKEESTTNVISRAMKIKYKINRQKDLVMFCGHCDEKMLGNGSDVDPYRCKCGRWEITFLNNQASFILKEEDE